MFSSVTDANGIYHFPAFFVTASAPVIVEVGKLLKVDLALNVVGLAESMQVTAESPTIDVKPCWRAFFFFRESALPVWTALSPTCREAR